MDWAIPVAVACAGVASYLGARSLYRDALREPDRDGDTTTLRANTDVLITGLLLVALPLMTAAVIRFAKNVAPSDPIPRVLAVALLAMLVVGMGMIASAVYTRVRFDAEGVDSRSVTSVKRFLRWSEIAEVRLSRWGGAIVLTGVRGAPVRVNLLLRGVIALLDEIDRRLPRDMVGDVTARARASIKAPLDGTGGRVTHI